MSKRGRKNYIRHQDVIERIGSYLGTSFPFYHAQAGQSKEIFTLLMSFLLYWHSNLSPSFFALNAIASAINYLFNAH